MGFPPLYFKVRPLRNSRKSLLVPFLRVAKRQSWLIFLQAKDVFAPLAAIASQRGHASLTIALEDSLFQIEGHGVEEKFQFDFGRPEISRAAESVAAFECAKNALHL